MGERTAQVCTEQSPDTLHCLCLDGSCRELSCLGPLTMRSGCGVGAWAAGCGGQPRV